MKHLAYKNVSSQGFPNYQIRPHFHNFEESCRTVSQSLRSTRDLNEKITTPSEQAITAIGRCPGSFAVVGAGGKMGFHVTRTLQRILERLGRTDSITAVSRFGDPRSVEPFDQHGINTLSIDLTNPSQRDQLPEVENVLFLAGIKFGTSSNRDVLWEMNERVPWKVAQHYRHSRIVALSTGCVYSFVSPLTGGSKETDPLDPPGEYARSCLARERAFQDVSAAHQTPTVLVRLNYSNDCRYGVLVDIAQKLIENQPIDLSTGFVNVIWQGDAVDHIIQCLPLATSPALAINVTGPSIHQVREIAKKFATRFECDPEFIGTPQETAWLNDASRSHQLFGVPPTSLDEMIELIADWLRHELPTLGKPTQFQVRDGNY